ncbi:hypothetical protein MIR68_003956 [Amoeboaphelidium protococcarum]|nr:hypothetical protein MIR68_003956 [Amoeboaphelidium protococcarum]
MKVCFLTRGTRGDVQPVIALARFLMTQTYPGTNEVYQPLVMTSGNHRVLVESYNVPYAPLQTNREFQNNIDVFAEQPEIVDLIAKGDTMNAVTKTGI